MRKIPTGQAPIPNQTNNDYGRNFYFLHRRKGVPLPTRPSHHGLGLQQDRVRQAAPPSNSRNNTKKSRHF